MNVMSDPTPASQVRLVRLFPWAAVASAAPAAWPFLRLPAWSTRARLLVGEVVGLNLLLAAAGALLLAAALALKPRVGRMSVPLGAALAAGLALAVPARNLDLSPPWQLGGRLLGCAVLVFAAARPALQGRTALRSGLAAAGAAAILAAALSPTVRPDLVLITVDALRADRVQAPEYRHLVPNLTDFARNSVRFTKCWSAGTWTVPAMSSIFTGVLPTSHGGHFLSAREATPNSRQWFLERNDGGWHPSFRWMSRELETLAQALSRGGYATGAFDTNWAISVRFGVNQGFQETFFRHDRDNVVADLANEWADRQRRTSCRPFFLWVHFLAAHRPYEPPPEFLPRDYVYKGPLPRTRIEVFDDVLDGEPVVQRVMHRQVPLAAADLRHIVTLYDGEVRWLDVNFGRFLSGFDRDPSARETLIAVTADHGDFLGEKNLLDHGHLPYEGVLRIPLIVRFPSSRRPGIQECASAVSSIALYPTFLRAAGVEPRHAPASEDLLAVVSGGCRQSRRVIADAQMSGSMGVVFGERFAHSYRVITDGRWKLLRRDDGALEMYDLDRDPDEAVNRATTDARQAVTLLRALEGYEAHEVRYPAAPEPTVNFDDIQKFRALGYLR